MDIRHTVLLWGNRTEAWHDRYIRSTNPTLYLRPDEGLTLTTSTKQVTTWASRVGSISFTTGTESAKPWKTRADECENRARNSEDFTTSTWDKALDPCSVSGSTITATAGTERHGIMAKNNDTGGAPGYGQGGVMISRFDVEQGNQTYGVVGEAGDTPWHVATVNFSAGTINDSTNYGTLTITPVSGARYIVEGPTSGTVGPGVSPGVWVATGAPNSSPPSWNAAGTETVKAHAISTRQSGTYPNYIKTGAAAEIAGMNDRQVLQCGPSKLSSTSILSNVFAASAKTLISVVRPAQTGSTAGCVFSDLDDGVYFAAPGAANTITLANYSGSAQQSITGTMTKDVTYVVDFTHDGSYLRLGVNGTASAAVSSGATDAGTLAKTIHVLAYSTQYFYGKMGPLILWNRVLLSSEIGIIKKGLAKKYGASCR